MLSVELTNLADILDAAGQSKNVSDLAREWSSTIKKAIMNNTVRHSYSLWYRKTDTPIHTN
jgi:hypothetical protein